MVASYRIGKERALLTPRENGTMQHHSYLSKKHGSDARRLASGKIPMRRQEGSGGCLYISTSAIDVNFG